MIPGHACNAFCSPDEHCELVYSTFDFHRGDHGHEIVRRHHDDAYRRRYGARVTRCEPAREAMPIAEQDPNDLTPLVGFGGVHAWLVWFIPPGPAAEAVAAAEDAAWAANLAEHRARFAAMTGETQ